jgi:uncharacterized membrane protein
MSGAVWILDAYWDRFLAVEPLFATAVGDARFDDVLPDPSEAGRAERQRVHTELLEAAADLDVLGLRTAAAHNRGTEPLVLSAAQLTAGTLMLGAALPWIGRQPITLSSTVVLSVVALGVLSTGIAYVLNYRLIQDEGPTAASMTNYLAPVVAVLLGVALVEERLSWTLAVGTAVVLVGVWIAEHNPEERGAAASDVLVPSGDGEAQARERIR